MNKVKFSLPVEIDTCELYEEVLDFIDQGGGLAGSPYGFNAGSPGLLEETKYGKISSYLYEFIFPDGDVTEQVLHQVKLDLNKLLIKYIKEFVKDEIEHVNYTGHRDLDIEDVITISIVLGEEFACHFFESGFAEENFWPPIKEYFDKIGETPEYKEYITEKEEFIDSEAVQKAKKLLERKGFSIVRSK